MVRIKPTPDDTAEAARLVAAGYLSISRKYRTLAVLPPGVTGIRALLGASKHPRNPEWAMGLGERGATSQYLRVYSKDDIVVSPAVYAEFRRLGGQSA